MFMDAGGMTALVRHLKGKGNRVIQLSAECIKELAEIKLDYASRAVQDGAIPSLVQVLQENKDPEVLVQAADALANIAHSSETHKSQVGSAPGAIVGIVNLFVDNTNKDLLIALTRSVYKIAYEHRSNQNAFISHGVAAHVIMLTNLNKNRDLQLSAVDAEASIAEGNSDTQQHLLAEGAVSPLMSLLKKSRNANVQVSIYNISRNLSLIP